MSGIGSPKFIITVGIALAGVAVSCVLFWSVLFGVRGGAEALRALNGEIDTLRDGRKHFSEISGILEKKDGDIGRIEQFFVDRNDPLVFIKALEGLAKTTGTALDISLQDAKAGNNTFAFQLAVEGSASGITRFVRLLEQMPYGVHVDDVLFQEIGGRGDVPRSTGGRLSPTHRAIFSIHVET